MQKFTLNFRFQIKFKILSFYIKTRYLKIRVNLKMMLKHLMFIETLDKKYKHGLRINKGLLLNMPNKLIHSHCQIVRAKNLTN